jgi:hypothetical protein
MSTSGARCVRGVAMASAQATPGSACQDRATECSSAENSSGLSFWIRSAGSPSVSAPWITCTQRFKSAGTSRRRRLRFPMGAAHPQPEKTRPSLRFRSKRKRSVQSHLSPAAAFALLDASPRCQGGDQVSDTLELGSCGTLARTRHRYSDVISKVVLRLDLGLAVGHAACYMRETRTTGLARCFDPRRS